MKVKFIFGIFLLFTILSCTGRRTDQEGINDSSLARVIINNELVVGVDPSTPPLSFYSSTGQIAGYEIDIAQAVADKLGVKLRLVPISTANRIAKLENRTINYIASGFINNETNAERFLLSTPYLRDALVVVVLRSMDGTVMFNQFSDLRNKRIGMLADEEMREIVMKSPLYINNGRRPYLYPHQEDMLTALDFKQLDAVVMNLLTYYSKITIEKKLYEALGDPIIITTYSYAFRKEDKELAETMNALLYDMARDGSLRRISAKWFGADVSIVGKY
ncbi:MULTISPECIES: ABC transporter substrate-binding protein [unclassified Treponema]|uniref:substrate-binding periplasmic protein n=1 Tax=unclassified Treponema TaxID=2638727 RepID=UPI0005301304|nr:MULTISPECIES: transporter substrate-binding domain-containing protein [unclassified Treponema]AIW88676.1 amino acid ABC transporter substrate-binding protein [Treponema sp. OMZ 838]UTC44269.1 amino acid ABC transporter substrate-binding protein [Treponema sp. OMZ 857]UTC51316.1 amino acid ABC transporter substrate-binding protein [Treponema sp. OMZ 855]